VEESAAKRVLVTDSLQDVGIETLRQEGVLVDVVPTLPSDETPCVNPPHAQGPEAAGLHGGG
jgi:hypothetical protein